jgi:hypothetical protein
MYTLPVEPTHNFLMTAKLTASYTRGHIRTTIFASIECRSAMMAIK